MKVLFVCTGNLYRSQAAEVIARKLGVEEVRSAGISDSCERGKRVPRFFRKILLRRGYPIEKDTFQKPICLLDVSWADHVFYMQPSHRDFLMENFGSQEEKFEFLGAYSEWDVTKIPDVAFAKEKASKTIFLIERCIRNFLASRRIRTVINIRGTSGSGKTSAVKAILRKYSSVSLRNGKGKVWAHRAKRNPPLYAIGPYKTSCSGCDRMPTQDSITNGIRKLSKFGDVIFEGFFVSQITGRYAALARTLPGVRFIFAFIDTPLKKALKRLRKRRLKTGITKPLKTRHIISHYRTVKKIRRKLKRDGFCVRILPHKAAPKTLLRWLDEEPQRFPRR